MVQVDLMIPAARAEAAARGQRLLRRSLPTAFLAHATRPGRAIVAAEVLVSYRQKCRAPKNPTTGVAMTRNVMKSLL